MSRQGTKRRLSYAPSTPQGSFILLLHSLEKVHVRKLAHFLDIMSLYDLFIIEEHPRGRIFAFHRLSNESDIVTRGIGQ